MLFQEPPRRTRRHGACQALGRVDARGPEAKNKRSFDAEIEPSRVFCATLIFSDQGSALDPQEVKRRRLKV